MESSAAAAPETELRAWPARFELLDAWRGLAAFIVLLHHMGTERLGHEAVMLFFVISGYCIAAAADSAQRRQLPLSQFMWRRLRRIYPPYFFAVIFFLITRFVKMAVSHGPALERFTPLAFLQNFTLTQWLSLAAHPKPNASNNPTLFVSAFWSLNYEEQFYLCLGLCLLLVGRRGIHWIVPVGAFLALSAVWIWAFDCLRTGFFLDYWLHFGVGCLLFYRLVRATTRMQRLGIDGILLGIGLLGAAHLYNAEVSEELMLCAGFAGVLILLRRWDDVLAKFVLLRPLMWLGTISYSLYLIHQFNLSVAAKIGAVATRGHPVLGPVVAVGVHLTLAVGFWFLCERPFLNRPLAAVEPAPAPSPSPVLAADPTPA